MAVWNRFTFSGRQVGAQTALCCATREGRLCCVHSPDRNGIERRGIKTVRDGKWRAMTVRNRQSAENEVGLTGN